MVGQSTATRWTGHMQQVQHLLSFLLLGSCVLSAQGDVSAMQSFEDALPAGIRAAKGTVSISDGDCQDGRHSLRWQFVPGDRLVIPTGPLGNINVWTGYGGYSRSAFEMRIRTSKAAGSLTARFLTGGKTGGRFEIPLVFAGWQRIAYHYSWKSRLKDRKPKLLAGTDQLVIEAPKEGEGGTIFIDALYLNRPIDFRRASEAIRTPWQPHDPRTDPAMVELLGPPTEEELAALDYFRKADLRLYPSRAAKEADVAKLEKTARETYGLARTKEGRVAGIGLRKWQPLTGQMLAVAKFWRHTEEPKLRQRLADLFFLQNDFLRQQGGVAQGALQGMNWYGGRNHADACYIMREPLLDTGRLPLVMHCLQYNFGYDKIFRTGYAGTHMDYFYIDARYLFKTAVMQTNAEDAVIHLRAFSRRYSRQLVDTIKPDGSLYHHGFHYFAYAGGASREMAKLAEFIAPTPFRVTPEAYDSVKRAFLAMRWYANVRDLPMTLHGRHPGRQRLFPDAFRALAAAGRPYHDSKLDPDLARAALRLDPGKKLAGFTPEPAPTGHRTMPYAGLGSHRRGEWLATVRGYGKYLAAQESYNNANRHGLFFGNGYLDILGGGNPVTLPDSGCLPNQGWDWRRLDGTTVIHLPYAQMANGNGTMCERSGETFVGGVSHQGRNGVFAMVLNSPFQYRKALPKDAKSVDGHAFKARKSYFFFDNRIVCLGSGIRNDDSPHPVQTNLFQKVLVKADTPIHVNGKPWTDLPSERRLDKTQVNTILNPQGTGYILLPGQNTHLARTHQTSRDGHDKRDTEGDCATAWIDHGPNPQAAKYSYIALVKTTPEELAQFSAALEKTTSTPVWPALRNDAIHACYDRATNTWGLAFFQSGNTPPLHRPMGLPEIPVLRVDHPCLVMVSQDGKQLTLSVAYPDLKLDKGGVSQPQEVAITLYGKWRAGALPAAAELAVGGDETVLTVACAEGKTVGVELQRP